MEQTFILIKPDGVLIGLAGLIISAFDKEGFTLKGLKMINVDRPLAEKHFQDVPGISLSPHLVNYICSGPVVAMIWEGSDVVSAARKIIEKTISSASDMDTGNGSNLIHGSDSLESAHKEIALWFPDGPVKLPSDAATPNARYTGRISVTGFDRMEQTLILIMPRGVLTGLVGEIICSFDMKGFTLKGLKLITLDRLFAEKHLSAEPFFSDRVDYISSGPVVAMIWEGNNAVLAGRCITEMTISSAPDMDTDDGSYLIYGSGSLESANKEIALWFPDGPVKLPSAVAKPKDCDIGRISVTGFDSVLRDEDVESALRAHFASCGQITDVFIVDRTRCCVAYIYFVGEGAVDKALKLSGSDVNGEWNVCAEAYPFRDHKSTLLTVQGYAPSLTESQIKRLLVKHFSSSDVEVTSVTVFERLSMVSVKGFGAVDKALELSGSYVKGRKVLVKCHGKPPRYTVHDRRAPYHYFTRIQK